MDAQPPYKFYTKYGGSGYDAGYSIKQTLDKGYIITGSTSSFGQGNSDLYLLKLDSMGVKQFETTFGGFDNEVGKSVVQLADSSFVILGYTSSFGFGGYDVFLVKADKNGQFIWQNTIGGNDWDFGNSLVKTSDGGFIIAGSTYNSLGYGNSDGYIVKTNSDGIVVWSKIFGGENDDEFKSIIQTKDGNFALAGNTKSYADPLGDAWIFKINEAGDSLKSYTYNIGLSDGFNDLKEANAGEIVTAGYFTLNSLQKKDGIFTKIDVNGVLTFELPDGQPGSDEEFFGVCNSNSSIGSYCVIGNSNENGTTFKYDPKLILLNSAGYYIRGGTFGGNEDDEFFGVCTTSDASKGYIAVGYTKSYESNLSDCFIFKFDSLATAGNSIIGINNIEEIRKSVSVFPNPFTNVINIKSYNFNYKFLEIITIQGEKVYSSIKIPNQNKIDLSFLESGIYFINIMDDNNKKFTQKIIKYSN